VLYEEKKKEEIKIKESFMQRPHPSVAQGERLQHCQIFYEIRRISLHNVTGVSC
jgi:hypothetical protein